MSNTQRPTMTPRATRGSEKKRKEALDRGLSVKLNGQAYTVREGDLTSMDTMALRRETGLSFVALMQAFFTSPDIDLVAALVWLARRQAGETHLPFEVVASEIDYDSDVDVVDAPKDGDHPEA